MRKLRRGDRIKIDLETTQPPFALFGDYISEDDAYVHLKVKEEENIMETFLPKDRIKLVTVIKRFEDDTDTGDWPFSDERKGYFGQ